MLQIKEDLLMAILEAARDSYPYEFFSLLGGKRKGKVVLLDHFIWIPHRPGRTSVHFNTWHIPPGVLASVHSHPFPALLSSADLHAFPYLGDYHLVVVYPFRPENVFAFDARGRRVRFQII